MTSKRHLIAGEVLCVARGGATAGVRRTLNLIEGANIALAVSDNPAQDRIDVTVSATSGALTEAAIEAALSHVAFDDATMLLSGASGQLKVDGVKVVGAQQASIPNATTATAVATLNTVLAALRSHGLIGPAAS